MAGRTPQKVCILHPTFNSVKKLMKGIIWVAIIASIVTAIIGPLSKPQSAAAT